jgi:membrane-associated phospholipid phosphatase
VKFGREIGSLAGSATLAYRAIAGKRRRFHYCGQVLQRISADQRRIWSCPPMIAGGDGWKPALGVLGATAALIVLDPLDTPWLQQSAIQDLPAVRAMNEILSGRNMAIAINTVPLAFFIGGLICRDSYAWQTGLLAAEAAADAEILAISMKHADRRMRPIEVGPGGDFRHTWFRTKNRAIDGSGCFPSGHTAAAFAVATVFAERYERFRRLAFGLAGIIGFSRLIARAHFPSDVFFGAALGYSISHFVVLRRQPANAAIADATARGHMTAGG